MTARVTLLNELVESDFLKISRSPDFDHFRSIEGLGDTRSIPLHCRGFAASFASLRLKSCSVYLQRTFPRILQARYATSGALVYFPMNDAASFILNGVEGRAPSLMLIKGRAAEFANAMGATHSVISLAHDGGLATAVVALEGEAQADGEAWLTGRAAITAKAAEQIVTELIDETPGVSTAEAPERAREVDEEFGE